MPGKAWRPEEDALVYDVTLSLQEVANRVDRPLHGVENRASRLGVRRNEPSGIDWSDLDQVRDFRRNRYGKGMAPHSPRLNPDPKIQAEGPWTLEVLACVRDTSLTYKQVEERTGRPWRAVETKAKSLGVRRQEAFDGWDDAELALVHDLSLSYAEVARRIGRSRMAVKLKAQRLGLNRPVFWTRPGYEPGADSYRGEDWPKFRRLALERDGYACQGEGCGIYQPSGTVLVVHHRIPWRLRPVNDLPWLVTLCRPCHMQRPEHFWTDIPEDVQALLELDRLAGGELSA